MAQGSAQQRLPEGSDLYQVAGQGPRQEVRVEPQCRRPGLPFEVLQQRKGLWTAHGLSQTGIGISLSCLLACLLARRLGRGRQPPTLRAARRPVVHVLSEGESGG